MKLFKILLTFVVMLPFSQSLEAQVRINLQVTEVKGEKEDAVSTTVIFRITNLKTTLLTPVEASVNAYQYVDGEFFLTGMGKAKIKEIEGGYEFQATLPWSLGKIPPGLNAKIKASDGQIFEINIRPLKKPKPKRNPNPGNPRYYGRERPTALV